MRLYLVQHGKAVEKAVDPARPLSEEGERELQRVAGFLAGKIRVEELWHSGKERARQTAECLAASVGPDAEVAQKDGLGPKDPVKPIAKLLKRVENDILIAGHLPHLAKLAGLLLAGDDDKQAIGFENAGVVCLEQTGKAWHVRWAVTPSLLGE